MRQCKKNSRYQEKMQCSELKIILLEEDKKIAFKQGYRVMAEQLQEMSAQGPTNGFIEVNKPNDLYFKLNTLPISVFDVKFLHKVSIFVLSNKIMITMHMTLECSLPILVHHSSMMKLFFWMFITVVKVYIFYSVFCM